MTSKSGTLDNLILKPVTRDKLKPDEVEIRVLAAGLNYKDVLKSLGMVEQHPMESSDDRILFGLECAGIVESVGSDVSNFKPGDSVVALHAPGCFGNFVTVKADLVVLKPDHLSFIEAATLPIVFLTAWYALVRLANIKKDDNVLIHSAGGGVGQAAIQIIKSRKAKVYATASAGKVEYLKSIGVEKIMNSRTLDFADELTSNPGEMNIVLNSLNGEYIPKSLDLLCNGGTFVEIGKIGIWSHKQVNKRKPDISYHSFDLEDLAQERPEFVRSMFKDILQEIANGVLHPIPIKDFSVSEITNAFKYMARSKHIGKIAITFPDNEAVTKNQLLSWSESTSLITGGFGGLGLKVAKWLMNKGCRNIVLCGRSKPSAEATNILNKMKKNGVNIISSFGNIADKDYVNHTIAKVKHSCPPLKGIIHAAGITEDAVTTRQNYNSFERVMLSKIEGSWNLHMATKDLSLDFFVSFSSFVSIIGWPGQGNYAAANAFMDTLMHYRKQSGLPATTINWGPWAEIGMAARMNKHLRDKFHAKGIISLGHENALSAMEKILNEGISQRIVLDLDWAKYDSDLPFFESFNLKPKTEKTDHKEIEKPFINQLTNAMPGEAKKMLISYIRSKLSAILGIKNPEEIHFRERLFDVGMDSLMAIELKNILESDLGYSFRNSLLFDYPTLESLIEHLYNQVIFPETKEMQEDIKEEDICLDVEIDSLLSDIDSMSETEIENQLMNLN
jgi:myxalamid-type polyketide synthase MxaB